MSSKYIPPDISTWPKNKTKSNTPLRRFCQCCDRTRRDGRRYWRPGTGQAFSAAWRQPAHTESSAARGFPHWSIAFAQRSRWSVWWLPTGLWSHWSHPRTERRPGERNTLSEEGETVKEGLVGKEGEKNTNGTENVKRRELAVYIIWTSNRHGCLWDFSYFFTN